MVHVSQKKSDTQTLLYMLFESCQGRSKFNLLTLLGTMRVQDNSSFFRDVLMVITDISLYLKLKSLGFFVQFIQVGRSVENIVLHSTNSI